MRGWVCTFALCITGAETQLFPNVTTVPSTANGTGTTTSVNGTSVSLSAETPHPSSSVNETHSSTSAKATLSFIDANITIRSSADSLSSFTMPPNVTITSPPSPEQTFSRFEIWDNYTRENNQTNACQLANDYWALDWSFNFFPTSTWYFTTVLRSVYDKTLSSSLEYSCTRTCGTVCYVESIITHDYTEHISFETTRSFAQQNTYAVPRPNCTIDFDDCLSIQTSYSSAIESFSSRDAEYQAYHPEPQLPACSACISTQCHFNGMFGVSVYYWPPTISTSKDYCAAEPTAGPNTNYLPDMDNNREKIDVPIAYVPITTGPYAVVDGITMYQGNVYLSYQEPQVQDNCGRDIPRGSPGHNVLTLASSALHSIRKFPHALAPFPVSWDLKTAWPVNYDDLINPPYSAYMGQQNCLMPGLDYATSMCSIVDPTWFRPHLLMPPQIRDLDPNWKSCIFDKYAAVDPPIALHTRDPLFSSASAEPTSTQRQIVDPDSMPSPGQSRRPFFPIVTPAPPLPIPAEPEVTIGPSVFPVAPGGGLVIAPDKTLTPGDSGIMVDGTAVNVWPWEVIITDHNGVRTIPMPKLNQHFAPLPEMFKIPRPQDYVVTAGSSTFTMDSNGRVIIEPGATISVGSPATTVDGTVYSLGPQGGLVISRAGEISTYQIQIPNNKQILKEGQVVEAASRKYTVRNGQLVLGTHVTMSKAGDEVMVEGTTLSVALNGTILVSGARTSGSFEGSLGISGTSSSMDIARETDAAATFSSANTSRKSKHHVLAWVTVMVVLMFAGG